MSNQEAESLIRSAIRAVEAMEKQIQSLTPGSLKSQYDTFKRAIDTLLKNPKYQKVKDLNPMIEFMARVDHINKVMIEDKLLENTQKSLEAESLIRSVLRTVETIEHEIEAKNYQAVLKKAKDYQIAVDRMLHQTKFESCKDAPVMIEFLKRIELVNHFIEEQANPGQSSAKSSQPKANVSTSTSDQQTSKDAEALIKSVVKQVETMERQIQNITPSSLQSQYNTYKHAIDTFLKNPKYQHVKDTQQMAEFMTRIDNINKIMIEGKLLENTQKSLQAEALIRSSLRIVENMEDEIKNGDYDYVMKNSQNYQMSIDRLVNHTNYPSCKDVPAMIEFMKRIEYINQVIKDQENLSKMKRSVPPPTTVPPPPTAPPPPPANVQQPQPDILKPSLEAESLIRSVRRTVENMEDLIKSQDYVYLLKGSNNFQMAINRMTTHSKFDQCKDEPAMQEMLQRIESINQVIEQQGEFNKSLSLFSSQAPPSPPPAQGNIPQAKASHNEMNKIYQTIILSEAQKTNQALRLFGRKCEYTESEVLGIRKFIEEKKHFVYEGVELNTINDQCMEEIEEFEKNRKYSILNTVADKFDDLKQTVDFVQNQRTKRYLDGWEGVAKKAEELFILGSINHTIAIAKGGFTKDDCRGKPGIHQKAHSNIRQH